MKILTVGLTVITLSAGKCFGQDALSLNGRLIEKQSGQRITGTEIILRANNQAFRSISDEQGSFHIIVPAATYAAEITRANFPIEVIQNVIVSVGDTAITLYSSTVCPFYHPRKWVPTCPQGHRNHLIPIVHGLPGAAMVKKAKAGKIRLGGCVSSDCEPTYYCPIHDKDL
jgi:hypothetical protein